MLIIQYRLQFRQLKRNKCNINIRSRSKYEIWCSKTYVAIVNIVRDLAAIVNYDNVISRFARMKKHKINI